MATTAAHSQAVRRRWRRASRRAIRESVPDGSATSGATFPDADAPESGPSESGDVTGVTPGSGGEGTCGEGALSDSLGVSRTVICL
jgi:hypothetical protein